VSRQLVAEHGLPITCPYRPLLLALFGDHRLRLTVPASEFLYSAGGIDKFLFTGEKGMASCANTYFDIPAS